jgi:hypothetical protein
LRFDGGTKWQWIKMFRSPGIFLSRLKRHAALGSGGKILVYCTPSSRSSPPAEKKEQADSADQAHDPVSSGWFPMFRDGKRWPQKAQNKITTPPTCPSIHNEFLTQRRRDAKNCVLKRQDALGSGGKILVYCTRLVHPNKLTRFLAPGFSIICNLRSPAGPVECGMIVHMCQSL